MFKYSKVMEGFDDSSLQLSISSSDLLHKEQTECVLAVTVSLSSLPEPVALRWRRCSTDISPKPPKSRYAPRPRHLAFFFFSFRYISILPSLLIVLLVCLWPLFPFSPAAARLPPSHCLSASPCSSTPPVSVSL